ncbi:MAG: penicillin-binding transpeptidase domain-containing protein [Clostridiales bacterium]|nr:penicillin-binding transpeptidase domain-containing protein [Clostridiales bacterium]
MRAELKIRKRMLTMLAVLTLLFLVVGVRIGSLTLFQGEALTARGVQQWTREGVVIARRGSIQDTNGETLALSATAYIVTANPQAISDERAFAQVLGPILESDIDKMTEKLENKKLASVILKRQVPRETVDRIRALKSGSEEMGKLLRGVAFEEDTRRFYTKGAFLSQVLGLTNVDSVGQSGLESRYEALLQGQAGSLRTEVDIRARMLPDGKTAYVAPKTGNTLRLTVDAAIQGVVEKAMRECLAVNNAAAVQCIVMDVNTGAILAFCMKPDYDPNDPPRNDVALLNDLMRLTAITDVYEPGSTFKILTCAAALDSGYAALSDTFNCSGSITVSGDRIRCWKVSHGHQNLPEALSNSCNPAFVNLALRMGVDTYYQYLHAFGLGRQTGIDLPGESAGILINSRYVKDVDLARIGFGQSVAVTPLQLICAASAVVNGGRLMRPFIVKEVLDETGAVIDRTLPQVVSQPISEETSRVMRGLLQNVVDQGGGKNAAVEGYSIGGKTGTAQVYKNGKVVSDVHIGSFIGFAPMENPQIAVLVTVHEAIVPVDYGSTTAAPFARQILADILPYLGIDKRNGEEKENACVPDVTGLSVKEAKRMLAEAGLMAETDGISDIVSAQAPFAGATMQSGDCVMLYTYEDTPPRAVDLLCVPDVSGLSMVEAGRQLRARGFEMEISGSGLAARQEPAAGNFAALGDTIKVTFELPQ